MSAAKATLAGSADASFWRAAVTPSMLLWEYWSKIFVTFLPPWAAVVWAAVRSGVCVDPGGGSGGAGLGGCAAPGPPALDGWDRSVVSGAARRGAHSAFADCFAGTGLAGPAPDGPNPGPAASH